MKAAQAKESELLDRLVEMKRVLVAFSGGVDSTYLAFAAHRALGDGAEAVTARSPSLAPAELDDARRLADHIGIPHRIVETKEHLRPEYIRNGPDRCYHCKTELFDTTRLLAASDGAVVVDGFNLDDLSDHRPGHRAAAEHGVRHPLAEVEMTKADIRERSRKHALPTWDKPQLACLASRLPYGMEVTPQRLERVARVEAALRSRGVRDVRARLVRENDDMVRLEVGAEALAAVVTEHREAVVEAARAAGFAFVTLDLEGFRSGRLNEELVALRSPGPDARADRTTRAQLGGVLRARK